MEALKLERKAFRMLFTKTVSRFEKAAEENQGEETQICFKSLQNYQSSLERLDEKIIQYMLESGIEEEELMKEFEIAQNYREKYYKCEVVMAQETKLPSDSASVTPASPSNLRLPKIELYKFDGNMLNWIKFWNTFKKIHYDEAITKEDKFYYLIQCVEKGTRAAKVLDSFPPSAENYNNAIESLNSRFGDKDLLIELYIRELLKLVLNSMTNVKKLDVTTLYDQLESHLRALDSLGITTEACAPLLYPLVESSLPEELLRSWQRHAIASSPKSRLERLIEFLKGEVQNEQRVAMAKSGFELAKNPQVSRKTESSVLSLPTAASLVTGKV